MRWYVGMGMTESLVDTPINRTKLPPSSSSAPIMAAVQPAASLRAVTRNEPYPTTDNAQATAPSASLAATIAEARQLADAAGTLAELEAAVRAFDGCTLKKTAKNTVFCDGIATSGVMLVGEAPGADEDREGIPFCGVSGRLLDSMLAAIGLVRAESFYITNATFWRPPGNRTPNAEELAICRPFVEKHIALINPKLLILVGGTAASSLLEDTRGITRLRGKRYDYTNQYLTKPIETNVIFHPSYLLRQPLQKKQAWTDLLAIREYLDRNSPVD